jgi:hypothetical protein
MGNTYSFVVSADDLKSHPVLQDIANTETKDRMWLFHSGIYATQLGDTWPVYLAQRQRD